MGEAKDALVERATGMGFKYEVDQFPVIFWDLFGEQGHPIRATVTEMGPLLLARLLDLNEVQEGVLNVAFKIADDEGLPLLDFKDLRAILDAISPLEGKKAQAEGTGSELLDKVKQITAQYGNVTKQSVGTIQRQLLVLENQGGKEFFGEPALDLKDFMRTDRRRARLYQHPRRRQADGESAALLDLPAVAALGIVRGIAGSRRSATSPSSCSSSTRRICCSPMRRRRCWRRSSRWSGSCAPRASASIS